MSSAVIKIKYKGVDSFDDSIYSSGITTPSKDEDFVNIANSLAKDSESLIVWNPNKLRDMYNSYVPSSGGEEYTCMNYTGVRDMTLYLRDQFPISDGDTRIQFSSKHIDQIFNFSATYSTENQYNDILNSVLSSVKLSYIITGVKESRLLSFKMGNIKPSSTSFYKDREVFSLFGDKLHPSMYNDWTNDITVGGYIAKQVKMAFPFSSSGGSILLKDILKLAQKWVGIIAMHIMGSSFESPFSDSKDLYWPFMWYNHFTVPVSYINDHFVKPTLANSSNFPSYFRPDKNYRYPSDITWHSSNVKVWGENDGAFTFSFHIDYPGQAHGHPETYQKVYDVPMQFIDLHNLFKGYKNSIISVSVNKEKFIDSEDYDVTWQSCDFGNGKILKFLGTKGGNPSDTRYKDTTLAVQDSINYLVQEYDQGYISFDYPRFVSLTKDDFLNYVGCRWNKQPGDSADQSSHSVPTKLLTLSVNSEVDHVNWFRKQLYKMICDRDIDSLSDVALFKQHNQFGFGFKAKLAYEEFISFNFSIEEFLILKGYDYEKFKSWVISTGNLELLDLIDGNILDMHDLSIDAWKQLFSSEYFPVFKYLSLDFSNVKFQPWSWLSDFFDELLTDLDAIKSNFAINSKNFDWSGFLSNVFGREDVFGTKINAFVNAIDSNDYIDGIDFLCKRSLIRVLKPFNPRFPNDIFLSLKIYFSTMSDLMKSTFSQDLDWQFELEQAIADAESISDNTASHDSYYSTKPSSSAQLIERRGASKGLNNNSRNVNKEVSAKLSQAFDHLITGFDFSIDISSLVNNIVSIISSVIEKAATAVFNAIAIASNMFKIFELSNFPISVGKDLWLEGHVKGVRYTNLLCFLYPGNKYVHSDSIIYKSFISNSDFDSGLLVLHFFNNEEAPKVHDRFRELDDISGELNKIYYVLNGSNPNSVYYPSFSEGMAVQLTVAAQSAVAAAAAAIKTPGIISRGIAAGAAGASVELINQIDFSNYMSKAMARPHYNLIRTQSYLTSMSLDWLYINPIIPSVRKRSSALTFIEVGKEVLAVAGGFFTGALIGLTINSLSRVATNMKQRRDQRKKLLNEKEIRLPHGSVDTDSLTMAQIRSLAKANANGVKLDPTVFTCLRSLTPAGLKSAKTIITKSAKIMKRSASSLASLGSSAAGAVLGTAAGSIINSTKNNANSNHDDKSLDLLESINRKLGF